MPVSSDLTYHLLVGCSGLIDDGEEVLSDFVKHEVSMGDKRVPEYVLRGFQLYGSRHGDSEKEQDLSVAENLVIDKQPLGQSDAPVGGETDISVQVVRRFVPDQLGQQSQTKVPHLQVVPCLHEHGPGHDGVAGSPLMAFWVLVRGQKFSSLTLNRLLMHTVWDMETEMSNAMVIITIRRIEAEVDNFHTACSAQETRCRGFLGFP